MSETPPLLPLLYEDVVRRALLEDLGRAGDITTDAIVPRDLAGRAAIVARAAGRVAGLEPALFAFRLLDPECRIERVPARRPATPRRATSLAQRRPPRRAPS